MVSDLFPFVSFSSSLQCMAILGGEATKTIIIILLLNGAVPSIGRVLTAKERREREKEQTKVAGASCSLYCQKVAFCMRADATGNSPPY